MHAVKPFRLTWDEVKKIGRDSLTYSFAPEDLKRQMLTAYDRDITGFEQRFLVGDWAGELAKVQPEVSGYAKRNLLP